MEALCKGLIARLKEATKGRDKLRKTNQIRWVALQDAKRQNECLRAENTGLEQDLHECLETLYKTQKKHDALAKDNEALRAQVEQMRDYIKNMEGRSKAKMEKKDRNETGLNPAQKHVLDAWNTEHPEMAMTPSEFLGR